MKIILTIILLCAGCGQDRSHNQPNPIYDKIEDKVEVPPDPDTIVLRDTEPMLEEFKRAMAVRGLIVDYSSIVLRYKDELSSPSNIAETYLDPTIGKIRIDIRTSHLTKLVLFHELGHALWGLKHTDHQWDIMYYEAYPTKEVTEEGLDDLAQQAKESGNAKTP